MNVKIADQHNNQKGLYVSVVKGSNNNENPYYTK